MMAVQVAPKLDRIATRPQRPSLRVVGGLDLAPVPIPGEAQKFAPQRELRRHPNGSSVSRESVSTAELLQRAALPDSSGLHKVLRRIVPLALFAVLVFSAVFLLTMALSGNSMPTIEYVVSPGETLWSIASRFSGERPVSETIGLLRELNGIYSGAIEAGQALIVPRP